MEIEIKKKKLDTVETQELIFKKYLRDYQMRHGKTFDELISMANDPRKFRRGTVNKKTKGS